MIQLAEISNEVLTYDRPFNDSPGRLVSKMADNLIGSEVLRIATQIRSLSGEGRKIWNLTVGDFSPAEFRIPEFLEDEILKALKNGETNYPPSDGVLELRKSVKRFYEKYLGLEYPVESILIASGARAVLYATYRALLDQGDKVVYPVPSWNNNHYVHLTQSKGIPVLSLSSDSFLPTRKSLEKVIKGAVLLSLNSPLNPTGTAFTREALESICDLVLEENAIRSPGERPLFLMYDQVYWMLTFGKTEHYHPVKLRPEIYQYTIYIDGISKAFAATGVRVGWAAGPAEVIKRMSDIIGHMGAWAPKAEQIATAKLLDSDDVIKSYHSKMKNGIQSSLELLYNEFKTLSDEGYNIECIPPMGAIYLSTRFNLFGRKTADGKELETNEDIRQFLLNEASIAVVPFQAFGDPEESGWFRLSVGTISKNDIKSMIPKLKEALDRLK
ncbi:MAG: pyridoxal phosphate-dependent aminotransferase [Ignavibacteria bacterium]